MAQRKQLTWTELRVGLFVLVALFVIAAGIFYVTGAGFLGPKYRLRSYFAEVAGVSNGAPVRLDGVDIGNVEAIRFTPSMPNHPVEKNRNIEVVMRLDKRFQGDILSDSTARLITEGLLGNRYVSISRGFTGVPLKENQEVPGTTEQSLSDVMASMQVVTSDVHGLVQDLQSGKGTLGKLFTDDQAYNNLNGLLAKGNDLAGGVQQGKGTLGKLVTDDTLYTKMRDTSSNLATATAKLNETTNTAGKLFSDPKLYENLTGVTGDMRLLIGDFRKNPKKFLHIKLSLF